MSPAAKDGFGFQDATDLLRLLTDTVERSARAALGLPFGDLLEIQIEASAKILPGGNRRGTSDPARWKGRL